MDSKFLKAMNRLCEMSGITPVRAFLDATDEEPGPAVEKMKNGWIPDEDVLCQLADYFGVGIGEFVERPNKKLCYLIGPITGRSSFMEEFQAAKDYLERRGESVCSPAHVTNVLPKQQMKREHFMRLGIALLSICDKAAVMPGWETHTGCQMEVAYAKANDMEIIWLSDENGDKSNETAGEKCE